jgi:hypothetical protein
MPEANLTNLLNIIAATGALGTAAMGLVDAFKVFWGGPSNFGYGFIKAAVKRFAPDTADGPVAFRQKDVLRTLRANWLNGDSAADQKAKARAMIHLRLTQGDAAALAKLVGVDAEVLQSAATKATKGEKVSPEEVSVLGQFDAVLSAVLDEAYERADQKYRNAAKLLAVIVATALALFAGWLIQDQPAAGSPPALPYLGSARFWVCLIAGLISAPIAPVAKDLTTALQNAVAAARAVKV